MCAAAISFARIRRLYYGAVNPKSGAIEHGPCFFKQKTCNHIPDIYPAIAEKTSAELLKSFFLKKRKKQNNQI
jgi:tRNA(Arg) A34 adenosine deaminase TadA